MLASVKEEAAARAWFDAVMAETGAGTSTEDYNGATLTLFGGQGEQQGAFAILGGKVALAGDVASVKAAVDTKGASGFASKAEPKAALEATAGDHIGFVYVALRPLFEWSSQLSGAGSTGAAPGAAMLRFVPDWAAFALRIEGDALVMEAIGPQPESKIGPSDNRTSSLADHIPGSAVVVSVSHDAGETILATLDAYRSDPSLKPAIDTLDQALGVLGGSQAAVGWMGDLAITVTRTDDALEGGLLIVPTDRAAAERLFTSLRTLVSLGGATLGVTVRDEAYAGTTITVVDLGELADLLGQAGISPDLLGAGQLPTGRIELSYAVTDQVVVFGSGPGFVKRVLDTTAATSIAANERYKTLAGRVGKGIGIAYLDLTAIREGIESALANADPAAVAAYEQEVKPFLVPFDALAVGAAVDGEMTRSTTIVTVK